MTASTMSPRDEAALVADDPIATAHDPLAAAREHIESTALADSPGGRVGLELEFHVVDLAAPVRRPGWDELRDLVAALPPMPSGSAITLEPGGQLELSPPPGEGVAAAVGLLRADRAVLKAALNGRGLGTAPVGTDLARPVQRVNPSPRYVAMETHFSALGCAGPGRAMMSATAALQVNLDAGPAAGWADRVAHLRRLGPVLVALSACSPLLAGRGSGWASMRQEAWLGIDRHRSGAVVGTDPAAAWADYALRAPVMLVRGDPVLPVTTPVPLSAWLDGSAGFARPATTADVDYHLTTLFPPVRPRGYLELRCVDALPDRWWPAVAAIATTLVDDPVAADRASGLCEQAAAGWVTAARDGLRDAALRAAVLGCVEVAAERSPAPLRADVTAYAELLASGRTPADELAARAAATDPLHVLEEEARA